MEKENKMAKVNFTQQTTTRVGIHTTETATYNTTIVIVQEQGQTPTLQSMRVSVQENENEQDYVGDMILENGRKMFNLTAEADFEEHYAVFSEILEEILGANKEDASEEQVAEEIA